MTAERGEGRGEHDPGAGDHPAGHAQPAHHPVVRPVDARSPRAPGHQEDRVVDRRARPGRRRRTAAPPGSAPGKPKTWLNTSAETPSAAANDSTRGDQQQRRDDRAQQQHEDQHDHHAARRGMIDPRSRTEVSSVSIGIAVLPPTSRPRRRVDPCTASRSSHDGVLRLLGVGRGRRASPGSDLAVDHQRRGDAGRDRERLRRPSPTGTSRSASSPTTSTTVDAVGDGVDRRVRQLASAPMITTGLPDPPGKCSASTC